MLKNIFNYFKINVDKYPFKTAVIYKNNRLSYKELFEEVKKVSYHLHNIGIRKGKHVALFSNNSIEFAAIMLSIAYLGATIVPLPLTLKGRNRKKSLESSGCEFAIGWNAVIKQLIDNSIISANKCISLGKELNGCYFYGNFLHDEIEFDINYNVAPNTNYIITMTSGSTGSPKPIIFTQETKIKRAITGAKEIYNLNSNDVILVSTPLYHSLAQRSLLLPLMIGATTVILPKFTPKSWVDAVKNYKVSFLFAVSNQLDILLKTIDQKENDFSSLKTIVSSSALLKNEIKRKLLDEFNCDIHECYGASEVGVVTNLSIKHEKNKMGSVGRPLPYVDVKICDEAKVTMGAGQTGEIACKTITGFSGYYQNKELTNECMDDKGYFYTGDIGYLDKDRYLYYSGRKKDVIITGGINVYPEDIEDVLNSFEEIKECAVIGVENNHFGEIILAILVEDDHHHKIDLSKIKKACLDNLTDYQQPLSFEIVDKLPKNALGKTMKNELKQQFKGYKIPLYE